MNSYGSSENSCATAVALKTHAMDRMRRNFFIDCMVSLEISEHQNAGRHCTHMTGCRAARFMPVAVESWNCVKSRTIGTSLREPGTHRNHAVCGDRQRASARAAHGKSDGDPGAAAQ